LQLVHSDDSSSCDVLAFADSAGKAETLLEKCVVAYIERQNGVERASNAFEAPPGEGLFLVKVSDIHYELHRKSVTVVEAGWIYSESITRTQTKVGDFKAHEFQINALDKETSYVQPTETLSGDLTTVPRTIRMVREERRQPWMTELKGHPRFTFKEK
jgi:hypothetical protein